MSDCTPKPWKFERGGGHNNDRIVGSASVQIAGAPESDGKKRGRFYSNVVCEITADPTLPGPAANIRMIESVHDLFDACKLAAAVLGDVTCMTAAQCSLVKEAYEGCMTAVGKAKGHPSGNSRSVEEVALWLFDEAECTLKTQPDTCDYHWAVEDAHGNVIAEGHTMTEAIFAGERVASQYV